jgi:signal transduction histidine kinase
MSISDEKGSVYTGPRQCNNWSTRRIIPLNNSGEVIENQRLIALGQLAAGVVHDLKNFCGQVKGLQYLASNRLKDQSYGKVGEYLVSIGSSVDSIVSLCDSMLEFGSSRIGSVESVLLKDAVTDVMMMATSSLFDLNHEVYDRYEGARTRVSMFQVQLIRNARQALQDPVSTQVREGGRIAVVIHPMRRKSDGEILECDEPDRYVGVSVDDNGVGMSEAVLSQIARPFFTTKANGKGTGLGLFMSAHIADLHGGALVVRTRLGEGTRVTLCLPVNR